MVSFSGSRAVKRSVPRSLNGSGEALGSAPGLRDEKQACQSKAVPTLAPGAPARRVCLNCEALTAPITLTDEPHKVYGSECAGAMLMVLAIWKRWLHWGHMPPPATPSSTPTPHLLAAAGERMLSQQLVGKASGIQSPMQGGGVSSIPSGGWGCDGGVRVKAKQSNSQSVCLQRGRGFFPLPK